MAQSPVITTGLWPIAINKGWRDNFLVIYMYGPKHCSDYRPVAHCHE